MRVSNLFTKTSKTVPADEASKNAQLLIKAGFIHKEMAGVYAYLPLGLRVIEKIKNIIRREMNSIGGQELAMTTLQPKDIWEKTDRWDDKKVDNWFKTKLFNGSELGVGLTHEEPIVDAVGQYLHSYKDLPFAVYQIQTKFRNEKRAKSGLLRGREFIMKDMYSFCATQEQHDALYEKVVEAYLRIYSELGLGSVTYRTYADGGIFTKKFSDEFQVLADVGEDTIYVDEEKKIAVNKEIITDENLCKLGINKDKLVEKRGVEVGNTFHLESKYTDALDVYYNDDNGNKKSVTMGCYGIGVSRLMGVIAEHFSDSKGLIWPENIAPFHVYLVSIGNDSTIVEDADKLYETLENNGIDTLYDDRDERAGSKFSDADLMGIPYRITVSSRLHLTGRYELQARRSGDNEILTLSELLDKLR
jgi:prolyl-tRNA synthetase